MRVEAPGCSGIEVWASAPWRELATSWLDEQLSSHGIRRTGEVEQPHLRPWATVLTAPTTHGSVWLKATGPGAAFEAGLYDWGDAVIAHPFACMLVPLGWAQRRLATSLDAPDLLRIRDAYLEVFGGLAPHAELVETLELACRVGKVARSLTWARAVAQSDPGELDDHYASAPLACLRSLLDDSYLGGA